MSTENMPTTNQEPEEIMLADKIPPTVAAGFQKAVNAVGSAAIDALKKTASTGMGAS